MPSGRNRLRRKVLPRDAAPLMINQALSRKQATLSELYYVVYEIEKDGAEMLVRKIGQSEIAIAVLGEISNCAGNKSAMIGRPYDHGHRLNSKETFRGTGSE